MNSLVEDFLQEIDREEKTQKPNYLPFAELKKVWDAQTIKDELDIALLNDAANFAFEEEGQEESFTPLELDEEPWAELFEDELPATNSEQIVDAEVDRENAGKKIEHLPQITSQRGSRFTLGFGS